AARSRSLFVWDDGSPMRFYVRPGLAKLRLAPLVLAGGGRLCRVREPKAVLLAQPGEAAPAGAVSTDYVTECVERNQRLPLEDFRLPPSPPSTSSPLGASARGRLAFTEAEDAALLRAVRGRSARLAGRELWKELERAGLTRHSWQAMRDRYLRHLQPRLRGSQGMAEAADSGGFFEAANREFESTESGSDTSDISELSARDGKSPGESTSGLRTQPADSVVPDAQLQREERPTSTCSSSSAVGEAVKTLQHFMEKFNMDLLTVTQALLKNTGEVEATLYFLQTGQRSDGYPLWSRQDDLELQKDDECIRNKLIAKFGAENVAKRIVFRET
ncbi:TE2IP protein, partial [Turnix velox]|nr:TE2IP protein [Turnix velox]